MKSKKLLIGFLVFFILFELTLCGTVKKKFHDDKMYAEQRASYSKMKDGNLCLTDQYDSRTSSFSDFYVKDSACDMAKNVYKKLTNDSKINYFEYTDMSLYYVGRYEKKDKAKHEFVNEKEDDEIEYTACSGMWMDEKFCKLYQLDQAIELGRSFKETEYNITTDYIIPVILGSNYKDAFKLGERFKANFLWEDIECEVVGFLKPTTSITIETVDKCLDDYVILPTICADKIKDPNIRAVYWCSHLEGMIRYKNAKEYHSMAKKINLIAKETGFHYTHLKTYDEIPILSDVKKRQMRTREKIYLGLILMEGLAILVLWRKK